MNSLTYSGKGIALTERFEGCKLSAYRDLCGVLTIGYGHTHGVSPSMTCTQEQADAWLAEDIKTSSDAVNRLVTVPITQGEHDALTDFVFNLGAHAFAESTMLDLLNEGNHIRAAGQFERWSHAGGVVVAGLLRRRLAEKSEFIGEAQ